MEGINLPPFLIEKIFPPKECIALVDTNEDGLPDSIQILAINCILQFTIPETINLGDFNLKTTDISNNIRVMMDSEPLELYNMKYLMENVSFYIKGEKHTINSILSGDVAGKTVDVGDKITILLKLKEEDMKKIKEVKGNHELTIKIKNLPIIIIKFELHDENMNIKFDPSKIYKNSKKNRSI